ncbi:MAG: GNAT family N-acetyltransferase [Pseudarthrobacter sp.]
MTALAITPVKIPSTPDAGTYVLDGSPDSATEFQECHALLEAHELEKWGNLDRCPTLLEDLEYWRGSEYEERHLFIARQGGDAVGMCSVTLPLRENTTTAGINVLVSTGYRRQGRGRRLLEYAEAVATARARTSLDAYCELPADTAERSGRLVPAKSGAGGLPADDPSVAFAAGCGYELEQVERASRLALPVPADQLEELESAARRRAGGDYALVAWADKCPEWLVGEYAMLRNRMTIDVPTAGLNWEAEDWDPARVRHEERANGRGGVQAQVAAALHESTGRLVAYTVLTWRAGVPASIIQQDTLVTAEHRGKKLGLLTKAANLRSAQERWPAARSVLTWNAVENQHMLAINTLLGFKPAGYEGEWQKRLE